MYSLTTYLQNAYIEYKMTVRNRMDVSQCPLHVVKLSTILLKVEIACLSHGSTVHAYLISLKGE